MKKQRRRRTRADILAKRERERAQREARRKAAEEYRLACEAETAEERGRRLRSAQGILAAAGALAAGGAAR